MLIVGLIPALEVDCMMGAVVEIADRSSPGVPCIRAVHACIEAIGNLQRL
jgi:hypothetical protein